MRFPAPVSSVLAGADTVQDTMSAPAAGELVFALDAAQRAGTVARWLFGGRQTLALAWTRPGAQRAFARRGSGHLHPIR